MLDYRMKTFLTLCELLNYTRTAERLFITQPAVTQHIQYLEGHYHAPLFEHCGKALRLTHAGDELRRYALAQQANEVRCKKRMGQADDSQSILRFGATLSIGEYVMPRLLARYVKERPEAKIQMLTENTRSLLQKLDQGQIDFAIVEGRFDKSLYCHELVSREPFLAVVAPSVSLPEGPIQWEDILHLPLIVREKGSGTRDILESLLLANNLTLDDFASVQELGNFSALMHLVKEGLGITFAYLPVLEKGLEEGTLCPVNLQGVTLQRDFRLVTLKGSLAKEQADEFLQFIRRTEKG